MTGVFRSSLHGVFSASQAVAYATTEFSIERTNMNLNHFTKFTKRSVSHTMVIAAMLALSVNALHAAAKDDADSLARGAVADVTPQQKYRTAIREAGGAYKAALRDCAAEDVGERKACQREAKATYDQEMALARLILK